MIELLRMAYWDMCSKSVRHQYVANLIRNIPGKLGIEIRRRWYNKRFKKCGKNLNILPGAYILNPQNIECDNNVTIGACNYLQAGGGIKLGSDVLLGPYVKIWSQNHNYKSFSTPVNVQGYTYKAVEIGEDVWVGSDVLILPGAKIGRKSIIAACSVVLGKEYSDGIILAGKGARIIGERRPDLCCIGKQYSEKCCD